MPLTERGLTIKVLNMEPITENQIAQGIAPGNNWSVALPQEFLLD